MSREIAQNYKPQLIFFTCASDGAKMYIYTNIVNSVDFMSGLFYNVVNSYII
jgi:hypothetical protein